MGWRTYVENGGSERQRRLPSARVTAGLWRAPTGESKASRLEILAQIGYNPITMKIAKTAPPNPIRRQAAVLLAVWLVILLGVLAISFMSASCLAIECSCTAEFIDGVRRAAYHSFQLQISAILSLFIAYLVVYPLTLLQGGMCRSCFSPWHLARIIVPPPRPLQ
jgi:hypothetical protein